MDKLLTVSISGEWKWEAGYDAVSSVKDSGQCLGSDQVTRQSPYPSMSHGASLQGLGVLGWKEKALQKEGPA